MGTLCERIPERESLAFALLGHGIFEIMNFFIRYIRSNHMYLQVLYQPLCSI